MTDLKDRVTDEMVTAYMMAPCDLDMACQDFAMQERADIKAKLAAVLALLPQPTGEPAAWRWRHTAEVYGEGCTPGPWNEGHPPPHTPGEAWRYQAQPLFATSPDVEALTAERDAALARAERAEGALKVIGNAAARSKSMFGGSMSEVSRVFEHIERVATLSPAPDTVKGDA